MARDGSSGGVIRMVTIDQTGVEKQVILGTYSELHVLTCTYLQSLRCDSLLYLLFAIRFSYADGYWDSIVRGMRGEGEERRRMRGELKAD